MPEGVGVVDVDVDVELDVGVASPPRHVPGPLRAPPPRSVSRRVRRNRTIAAGIVLAALGLSLYAASGVGTTPGGAAGAPPPHHHQPINPRLTPDWEGDGRAVTIAAGGDVNSESTIALRLAADPSTAFGPGAKALLSHADLAMVNLETALTEGACPVPQPKEYVFTAPPSVITALRGIGATLVTEANNHGEDCGQPGLLQALSIRARLHYPVIGIGHNAKEAFTSYQTEIAGQRIGIIAATQVIDADLISSWSATSTQPGLASAYEVQRLVNAVEAARRIDDTVIVFLHWGIQLDACPDSIQEPLATLLVKAGADIVIGSHAHVLLGTGYLGTSLVSYGLGNFAFYNDPAPTNLSGSLRITVTGRHIDAFRWQPAIIEDELPVPVTGADAAMVQHRWQQARSCTDLSAHPTRSLASPASEVAPVPPRLVRLLS